MENKKNYMCEICGTYHDTVAGRAACEQACVKKQEAEVKKAEEAKKQAEYEARAAEVDAAFDHAYKLRDAFLKDYDSYAYTYHKFNREIPCGILSWVL